MHRRALPIVTLALALAAHWWLWRYSGKDIGGFLLPWFAHIQTTGPVAAFAQPFGDYAPPYLYLLSATTLLAGWFDAVDLIKALSVAGTIALAGACWHLLRIVRPDRAGAAALVLLMPTATLNAALLGQCDAMWSAACVMALAAALQRRHAAMLAWCGIALGFKLQAAFFFPFVLGLLIARRVPLRLWPIGPAVWFATLLPAWSAGWPLGDLLTIYLRQGGAYAGTVLNAPNLWSIADALPALDGVPLTGLGFAAAIGASAAYVAWLSSRPQYGRQLMEAALLAPLLVVGLLPRMHERYFFLADVLSLVIALAWPDRRSVTIAALVQAGSLLALLAYMSGVSGLAGIGAVAMIVATIRLARPLLVPAANDNPVLPPLRPSTA